MRRNKRKRQGDDNGSDESHSDISSLLTVNRMDYRVPPSLSIVTARASKSYPARNDTYTMGGSHPMQFIISTGAHWVDWKNSYVEFDVELPDLTWTEPRGRNPDDDPLDAFPNWPVIPKFATGCSWLNSINGLKITHSSGVELEAVNNQLGSYYKLKQVYEKSSDRRKTEGILSSHNESAASKGLFTQTSNTSGESSAFLAQAETFEVGVNNIDVSNRTAKVSLCLADLSGFFNQDNISPSFINAGLQLDLFTYAPREFTTVRNQVVHSILENVGGVYGPATQEAEKQWIPPGPGNRDDFDAATAIFQAEWKIKNPRLVLDTYALTDSIQRKLSQISAQDGLEWYFNALHHQSTDTESTNVSMQVQRALSRANNIIVKSRARAVLDSRVAGLYDSMSSEPWIDGSNEVADGFIPQSSSNIDGTMTNFQVQLGAQYIPSVPLTTVDDFHHSALKTFSAFRRTDQDVGPTTNMAGFTGKLAAAKLQFYSGKVSNQFEGLPSDVAADNENLYYYGDAIGAVPLETSSTLTQSGSAISAQRTAIVNLEFKYPRLARETYSNSGQTEHAGRRLDLWCEYTKNVTAYLDSVVVRS